MSTNIESLELEIVSNSQSAISGIEALTQSLGKLKSATSGGMGLSSVSKELGTITSSTKKASASFTDFYNKARSAIKGITGLVKGIKSFTDKSADYTENMNLFSVAMGKYGDDAKAYADKVSNALGIDTSEWVRSQGVFMTLATGFGVAGDRAALMSQNLTQLGYDLASFYNIDTESAMQKLKSGLSGELEPLRNLGYDLSQAKLEATALSLGIDKSVSSMTQAEKAQLRYYAIMTQVTVAQGDMARTLDDPANQMRVLKAQIEMAARSIGNIFIPALNAILPVVTAVVQVIRSLADIIAGLFGYEFPEVDYSGVSEMSNAATDTSDAMDDAKDSAKKLKSYMLGFDELNVLNPGDEGGSSAADASGSGFDFELPDYTKTFLEGATNSKVAEIVEDMKEWLGITDDIDTWSELMDTRFGTILETVGLIGTGLLGWKISQGLSKAIDTIKSLKSGKFNISFGLIGATSFMSDLDKLKQYFEDFSENGATFENVSGMISEFAGIIGDALIVLGNVKTGAALKAVQGIGEIVSAISSISTDGVDITNVTDVIRGLSNIAIAVGLFTGNLKVVGTGMALQGFTTIIQEIGENWDAIKQGDWSGVDKATLVIGAIQALGGIVTALGVFNNLKKATNVAEAATGIGETAVATQTVSTATSTLSTKLTTLVKDLALGIAIIAEVAVAAGLIVGAIWGLGVMLEQVGIAWQPVIDNGATVATAMGIGTGLLAAIGVLTAALGTLGGAMAGQIAIGIAILAEIGVAAGLFIIEIWAIGVGLDEIGKAWQPVLDNGETIATAIGVGTGILVAIGVVAAALGVATVATAGMLPLAIGLGTAILLELGVAAGLFIIEISAVGVLLEQVGVAWQPVLDNGETIESAILVGTGLLVAIGVVTAALGVATVASAGLLPLAIGLGTALLVELAESFKSFVDSLVSVSNKLKDDLHPALSELNKILPDLSIEMENFISFMTTFTGHVVAYTKVSSISGIASTIDTIVGFFTQDPIEKMTKEVKSQGEQFKDLIKELEKTVPKIQRAIELTLEYNSAMSEYGRVSGSSDSGSNKSSSSGGVLSAVGDWFGSLFGRSSDPVSVPAYASGGFPEQGQMFIAREAGAEMVGSIGRRTAVANNDQIVSGIAGGVAEANEEQNALLREQNSLLRAILDKDGGVYLDGKNLTNSVEKYQRERGRVLITGGVM